MSDEKKSAPTPDQAEAARRLLDLRREIRRGLEQHHHDFARARAATRKRRPVLVERADLVALLERIRSDVDRLAAMRREEAALGALLESLTPAPPRPPSVPLSPEVLARVVRAVIAGRRGRRGG